MTWENSQADPAERPVDLSGAPGMLDVTVVRGLLHELRTPLNVLVGYADLIDDGSLAPGAQQRVGRIKGAANRMTGLLDLAADLARAVQVTPVVHDVRPADAMAMAVPTVAQEAAGRSVELRADGIDLTAAPAEDSVPLLARSIACLVRHAVHRSPGGSVVTVSCDDQRVTVTSTAAIDDPPGVPPPGQAGQRFWLEVSALMASSLGAGVQVEAREGDGWRATVTVPVG